MLRRRPLVLVALVILGCAEAPPPPAPAPPPPPAPAEPAAPAPPETVMLGGGCEEVKEAYVKACQADPTGCKDTAKSEGTIGYRAMLNDGAYLQTCGSPTTTSVKLCVAIRGGHALGVTVTTTPGDKRLSTCIGGALQAMAFPSSPGLDVASTVFAAQ